MSTNDFFLPHPQVCGQEVCYRENISFFGGFTQERPLKEIPEDKRILHSGPIYTYSTENSKVFETSQNVKHIQVIAGSTVYNKEIGISFTFGGLEQTYNKDTNNFEIICTANLYAHRWTGDYEQKMCNHNNSLFFFDPVDDVFNAGIECSDMFGIHNGSKMFTPSMSPQKPPARYFHSACWDELNNVMWIFGGVTINDRREKEFLNDIWIWSLDTGMWKKMNIENSPSPRIGSSMTYINGKIYLFGGKSNATQHGSDFFYLDTSILKNKNERAKMSWVSIEIPQYLNNKIYGAKILPYSPTINKSYIIFSGGTLFDIYDSITILNEPDNKLLASFSDFAYYDIQNESFNKIFIDYGYISYHSAGIIGHKLIFYGGIAQNSDVSTQFIFNKQIKFLHLGLYFSTKNKSLSNNIFSIINSVYQKSQSTKIPKKVFSSFRKKISLELEKTSKSERFQDLYSLYQYHQKNHFPINNFIILDDLYISIDVLKQRIGSLSIPSFISNRNLHSIFKDFALYIYTDIIDPSISLYPGFQNFLKFIEFCREKRLYRLIAYEIAVHIPKLDPYDFLTICLDTEKFPGKPMFDDPNLPFLKSMFCQIIPKFHSVVDFSKIHFLSPKTAKFLLSAINGEINLANVDIPSSTLESDLACFSTNNRIKVSNGYINVDKSALEFDSNLLSQSNIKVVRALETFSLQSLFDVGDVEDISNAFRLICGCKAFVDSKLLNTILNGSRSSFVAFASKSHKFRKILCQLLPTINFPTVLDFAIEMIGANGSTTIISKDQELIKCDIKYGPSLPQSTTITTKISKNTINSILMMIYNHCGIQALQDFFDKMNLADEYLTLCSTCYCFPPYSLRSEINRFIIEQLLENKDISIPLAFHYFPRLFDAGIHENLKKYVNINDLAIAASRPEFINNLSEEQMIWLIGQSNTSFDGTSNNMAFEESETYEDSEPSEDHIHFSK